MQTEDKMLSVYNAIANRLLLASNLGMQYGGERNLYEALGYKKNLTFIDYYAQFKRQDIANAIINRPVKATWRGQVQLIESREKDETALEREWRLLETRLKLKSQFARLDKLTGIGRYGVLLLGLNDVSRKEDLIKPVTGRNLKLNYIKPFSEYSARIATYEERTNQPRYGMPVMYELDLISPGQDMSGAITSVPTMQIRVHHSRILHIVDEPVENEIQGTPRLENVFNRLQDIEKLSGGSAEMFWRGARPGYQGELGEDYTTTPEVEADLQKQVAEYEHNIRRILISQGIKLNPLASQVADPSTHLDIQIQLISAVTGIPKRILTGTERGELASTQDNEQWLTLITGRREEFAEPIILRPFIDRCITYGVLPPVKIEVDGYSIQWDDLYAPSDKDRAEVGLTRARALKEYASEPMTQAVIPPDAFFEFFLGLTQNEILLISEMAEAGMNDELSETLLSREAETETDRMDENLQPEPDETE